MNKPSFRPGSFGCHEALHTVSIVEDMVDRFVVEHEAIKQHPKWLAKAKTISQLLFELYQDIGNEHLKGDND